jgi:hypothetical protein
MALNHSLIQQRLDRLRTSPFRAKFHLGPKERATLAGKGAETIRRHAHELISARLAPAAPRNDGKQTPFRGHPVFIAQHATATCCRNCVSKWHNLPAGRELTVAEQDYVVEVIIAWLEREIGRD